MNEVFIIGKIISEINFKFIINSNKNSIVRFLVELENKSIIKIKAYDNIADFCYQTLKKEDNVLIYGLLDSKYEVNIKEIELLESNEF